MAEQGGPAPANLGGVYTPTSHFATHTDPSVRMPDIVEPTPEYYANLERVTRDARNWNANLEADRRARTTAAVPTMSGRKRSRTASGSGRGASAQLRAMKARMRFDALQPWSVAGAARIMRGTPYSLGAFGASRATADAEQLANRRTSGWTGPGAYKYKGRGMYMGRGNYLSDLYNKYAGRAGAAAKAALNYAGYGQIAGGLTRAEQIGKAAMRAAGMGAYEVGGNLKSNGIVNGGMGDIVPSFTAFSDGVTVSHKEYISDIYGPENAGGFQNTVYPIQPGIVTTFPWLSQIAQNYEEYTLKQCIFTWKSTISDAQANTNGQVGSISIATQYNPSDTPFQTKQDVLEYFAVVSAKTSESILAGVECDPAKLSGSTGKFVRAGPVSHGQDLKQYDWGNLNVAVSNIPSSYANQALAELWVSYTVEFRKPRFFVSRGLGIQRDVFVAGLAAPATIHVLWDEVLEGNQNRIGGALTAVPPVFVPPVVPNANSLYYTFPAGFAGTVRVTCIATQGAALGGGLVGILPLSPTTTVAIPDIYRVGAWAGGAAGTSSAANETPVALFDCQVFAPTTAGSTNDNVVELRFTQTDGTTAQTWSDFQIEVTLLNTGFNYVTSGVIGNLMLDNPTTGELQPFP